MDPYTVADQALGRRPPEIDVISCRAYIENTVVLITGGGGSIGRAIASRITEFEPSAIVLLGHGENSIHEATKYLREQAPRQSIVPVIADIKDGRKILDVCTKYRPSTVFHTAAHKHVPYTELFPDEAVENNVRGTEEVLRAAAKAGTERLIFTSTDKAASGTNVLGATKRIGEMIAHGYSGAGIDCKVVRFGNVLGSRGSILPTLLSQIEQGGPVTITDPQMTRYFITLDEAVALSVQCGALDNQGSCVYLLDPGPALTLKKLVERVLNVLHLRLGSDIPLELIGARPGERLHERLCARGDRILRTAHGSVLATFPRRLAQEEFARGMSALYQASCSGNVEGVRLRIAQLVPEFGQGDAQLQREGVQHT